MNLTPKNWAAFQHYKDRKPPWIKLHRSLLDDYQFACLPDASQALAPRLWLLASEYQDGKITASLSEVAFRVRKSEKDLAEALHPLVENGFFTIASDALAACKKSAMPEREKETEKETEKEAQEKKDAAPPARLDSDEVQVFARGKKLLGDNAGSFIAKLIKAKGGNHALALAAVVAASTKQNPREYLGRIVSGADPPDDARSRGDAW